MSGQTLLLGSELVITKTLTIDGSALAEHVKISGGGAVRGFNVAAGANVTMNHLDVINGKVSNGNSGGGIYNQGTLTLTASTISGNIASGYGGGIYNQGTLTLTASTISGNITDGYGGGIHNRNGGVLTLNACTIANNAARYNGGGIHHGAGSTVIVNACTISGNNAQEYGGGISKSSNGTLTLIGSTLADNTAQYGGGIASRFDKTVLYNNLIGNNTASSGADCYGMLASQDYNLIQDTVRCIITGTLTHNITGQAPLLGPLSDNGGGTATHALLPGSPALDWIPNGANGCGGANTQDQRGFPRPMPAGGACDIGAYEQSNAAPVADAGASQLVTQGNVVTLNGGASYDPDSDPLTFAWTQTGGAAVSFTPTLSRTTFTAPNTAGILTFTLTVSDSHGLSDDPR
ncbi:MAG: hypothetical protein JXA21_26985 [Anaerolineae bacterium]|nr:hypothetical protein [Anaerolineae bacterium]